MAEEKLNTLNWCTKIREIEQDYEDHFSGRLPERPKSWSFKDKNCFYRASVFRKNNRCELRVTKMCKELKLLPWPHKKYVNKTLVAPGDCTLDGRDGSRCGNCER